MIHIHNTYKTSLDISLSERGCIIAMLNGSTDILQILKEIDSWTWELKQTF